DDDQIFITIAKLCLEGLSEDQIIESATNLAQIDIKLQETYDYVFLDLNMPEISGWEVLEKYKAQLSNPLSVVIICSSSVDTRDHERAHQLSDLVAGFISKPIDLDEVVAIHKAWKKKNSTQLKP
ncbi:MAG: response regulator, partial [Flavobacteriales bacterium]|nr:response regulator [Flavobacteriales bacterium]